MKLLLKKYYFDDLIMFIMLTATLAFHDKTLLMVGSQLFALIIELIIHRMKVSKDRLIFKYVMWELTFVCFALFSSLWATRTTTILSSAMSTCQVVMIGIIIFLYSTDKENAVDNLTAFALGACVILAFRLLVTVPFDAWGSGERIGHYLGAAKDGGYGNTGLTFVLSLGSVFALLKAKTMKIRLFYLVFVGLSIISILSGSKKAIIIFAVAIFVYAVLYSGNSAKLLVSIIFMAIACAVLWYVVMHVDVFYAAIGERVERSLNYFSGESYDGSTKNRANYLALALDLFKKHPIGGVGFDCFRCFNDRTSWAENTFLEMLADLGIIGFLIYFSFYFSMAYKLAVCFFNKAMTHQLKNATALFLSIIVVDLTMVSYRNDFIHIYLVMFFIMVEEGYKAYKADKVSERESIVEEKVSCV